MKAIKARILASSATSSIKNEELVAELSVDKIMSPVDSVQNSPRSPAPEVVSLQSPDSAMSSQQSARLKTINLRLSSAISSPSIQDIINSSPKAHINSIDKLHKPAGAGRSNRLNNEA